MAGQESDEPTDTERNTDDEATEPRPRRKTKTKGRRTRGREDHVQAGENGDDYSDQLDVVHNKVTCYVQQAWPLSLKHLAIQFCLLRPVCFLLMASVYMSSATVHSSVSLFVIFEYHQSLQCIEAQVLYSTCLVLSSMNLVRLLFFFCILCLRGLVALIYEYQLSYPLLLCRIKHQLPRYMICEYSIMSTWIYDL